MNNWTNPPIKRYAAVGSRETPEDMAVLQFNVAKLLCDQGWHGLSGLADGADSTYYEGAKASNSFEQVGFTNIIPWNGFTGGSKDSLVKHVQDHDQTIFNFDWMPNAKRAWCLGIGARGSDFGLIKRGRVLPEGDKRFKAGGMALHARNAMQVLGPTLRHPVRFVHCYAKPKGLAEWPVDGGTNTAVMLAVHFKIKVTNLATKDGLRRTLDLLKLNKIDVDYDHYEKVLEGYRV